MKKFFLILTLALAAPLAAFGFGRDHVTCRSNPGFHPNDTTQVDIRRAYAGVPRYILTVYQAHPAWPHSPRVLATTYVAPFTEDVIFAFVSDDRKVNLTIYMDELDQSNLNVHGQEMTMVCDYPVLR